MGPTWENLIPHPSVALSHYNRLFITLLAPDQKVSHLGPGKEGRELTSSKMEKRQARRSKLKNDFSSLLAQNHNA